MRPTVPTMLSFNGGLRRYSWIQDGKFEPKTLGTTLTRLGRAETAQHASGNVSRWISVQGTNLGFSRRTNADEFTVRPPDRGMLLRDVLRNNRFYRLAVNPMVFATPLLCAARWRF